jgi:Salmonella virulence plasmid 65kDa B protein
MTENWPSLSGRQATPPAMRGNSASGGSVGSTSAGDPSRSGGLASSASAKPAGPSGQSATLTLPTITLPKGGGAISGIGEKLTVGQATGTATLSVPVSTSPGRSGFGPALSLTYDSGAGNGPFGLGWRLSVPAVTRKTSKGLPRYEDAITDVILHVRYTARDGGQALAGPATAAVRDLLKSGAASQYLLLSLRHDFRTQRYAFTSGGGSQFTAVLPRTYFPHTTQGATLGNIGMALYSTAGQATPPIPATMASDLNTTGQTTISLTPDGKVLSPQATAVFLVIQYSVSDL